MAPRMIHTGQAIVDIVMEITKIPEPGGDVFADNTEMKVGGGFNVMAAARREGTDVLYAGGHGTGPLGDLVRQDLADEGVLLHLAAEVGTDTGFCVALIDENAERTFISTRGAECHVPIDALDELDTTPGDVVYVSGYSLHHRDNAAMLARFLPRLETQTVVIDASPVIADIPDDALQIAIRHATVWTVNAREAALLMQRIAPTEGSHEMGATAQLLSQRLSATVLVRIGPEGCWVAQPQVDPVLVPGITVTPIDTNGAGDAHTGVLCAGIGNGRPMLDSVRRANIAGGIAVTRRGPATSPTTQEIDAYSTTV